MDLVNWFIKLRTFPKIFVGPTWFLPAYRTCERREDKLKKDC